MFDEYDSIELLDSRIKKINVFFNYKVVKFEIKNIDFNSIIILAKSEDKTIEITFENILVINMLFKWSSNRKFIQVNRKDNIYIFNFSNNDNNKLFIKANKMNYKIIHF